MTIRARSLRFRAMTLFLRFLAKNCNARYPNSLALGNMLSEFLTKIAEVFDKTMF